MEPLVVFGAFIIGSVIIYSTKDELRAFLRVGLVFGSLLAGFGLAHVPHLPGQATWPDWVIAIVLGSLAVLGLLIASWIGAYRAGRKNK